ncbi:GDSL-type esterase/lipase family protein [Janibacter sp. G56]|uniref:GDSL-type esterase/lipase family protein n=1 Tax=Janibacter sp. G56 TaxID=3418717 RepID=UPI003D020469
MTRTPAVRRGVLVGVALLVILALVAVWALRRLQEPEPIPLAEAVTVEQPEALAAWHEAVAEADEQEATIAVLGDSNAEGATLGDDLSLRYLDRLQSMLRERSDLAGCPVRPRGFHGTTSVVPPWYEAGTLPKPAQTRPAQRAYTQGPGGRALQLGVGGSVTWRVDADEVQLGYRTSPTAGRLQVVIDGRVVADLVTRSARSERRVWERELAAGEHSVTARHVADPATSSAPDDTAVTVTDLTPYAGDRGRCVHAHDVAHSGIAAHDIVDNPAYLQDSLAVEPDLLVLPLGFNDAADGRTPEQFVGDLASLIAQARAHGHDGSVLILSMFTPASEGDWPAPWTDYAQHMRRLARTSDAAFVDLARVMPPVRGDRTGLYSDRVHVSAAGHARIAELLLPSLLPPQERSAS